MTFIKKYWYYIVIVLVLLFVVFFFRDFVLGIFSALATLLMLKKGNDHIKEKKKEIEKSESKIENIKRRQQEILKDLENEKAHINDSSIDKLIDSENKRRRNIKN